MMDVARFKCVLCVPLTSKTHRIPYTHNDVLKSTEEHRLVRLRTTAWYSFDRYPPHWVDVGLLWEAMSAINTYNNQTRGFFSLQKKLIDV
jgi:hypothetical protein